MTTIGEQAFRNCTSLRNIEISNSVNSIGENAFSSVTIIITDKGSYASQYAKNNNFYYGYWNVKNGVLTIGGNDYMSRIFNTSRYSMQSYFANAPWKDYAKEVTEIIIEDGITNIGGLAFVDFVNLKSVSIPNTITSIEVGAFRGCISLENIELPSSLESLDSTAFDGCSSLKSITIPASVSSIDHSLGTFGRSIFANCDSMVAIYVDENNENYCSVDGVLYTKDKKTLLKYPDGKQGEVYEIPDGVTNIGSQALLDVQYLTKLIIPKSIEEIDYYAISTLMTEKPIADIYYKGSESEWNSLPEIYESEYTSIHYNAIGINPPKIIGAPTISNNNLNINLSDVEYDSSLITVFSDDNKMISLTTTPLKAGDTEKSIVLPSNGETQAKVFIWNSLDGMRPLCEAKNVTVE